jgi:glycosyltransferase involved in cell wall biosynthesis
MNIGVIVDNDLNGDIRVLREVRILKENGIDVFVLCFGFSGKNYNDPVSAVKRITIGRRLKNTLFFFMNLIPAYEWLWATKIRRLITDHDLDYLHVHDLYMSRAAKKGIRRSGKEIPMILDLHENYPFTVKTYNWTKGFPRKMLSRPEAWKMKEHEYLNYADTIIVLSREFKDVLISEYSDLKNKNFVVFPNVPDLAQPEYTSVKKAENPFQNGFPILFYYGVIAERRGIFDALTVFASIVKEDYPVNPSPDRSD